MGNAAQVTVIPSDSLIIVNNVGLYLPFDAPKGLHALQWQGDTGHTEWQGGENKLLAKKDYTAQVAPFVTLWEAEKARLDAEAAEAERIYNSLPAVKERKRMEINIARDHKEQSGFPYLGKIFDSDPISAQRLNVAANTAMMAQMAGHPFSLVWTVQDNSTITLDADQLMGALPALALNANTIHEVAAALKAQVDTAQTVAEVEAIAWPE